MTDQAPELLRDIVERCRRYAVVIEGIIVVPDNWQPGEDHREVKEPRATLLEAADIIERLTRPTPAERLVAQVREARLLVDRLRWIYQHDHINIELAAEVINEHLGNIIHHMDALLALTARPSDAAVVWRELECVLNDLMLTVHDCRNLPTFKLRKELRKILEPLYALPPDEPARVTEMKLVYIKRWRTIVPLPATYADEIVEALRVTPPTVEEKRKLPDEEAAGKTATRLLDQWSEIAGAESFAPYQETVAFLGKPNSVGWIWAHEVRFERNFDVEQERTRNLAIQAIADAEERASPTIASEKECGKAVGEIAAWRVRLGDGSCTMWFDGEPPNYHGPYEVAYFAPPAASLIAKETP